MWNLLSHRYSEVLMGLNGSKEMDSFFSLPSSVTTVPQYTTSPLVGIFEYSFRRCCVEVMADKTESLQRHRSQTGQRRPHAAQAAGAHLFTRDLMLLAVPYSSASSLLACATCDFGGMTSEIMLVPLLRVWHEKWHRRMRTPTGPPRNPTAGRNRTETHV